MAPIAKKTSTMDVRHAVQQSSSRRLTNQTREDTRDAVMQAVQNATAGAVSMVNAVVAAATDLVNGDSHSTPMPQPAFQPQARVAAATSSHKLLNKLGMNVAAPVLTVGQQSKLLDTLGVRNPGKYVGAVSQAQRSAHAFSKSQERNMKASIGFNPWDPNAKDSKLVRDPRTGDVKIVAVNRGHEFATAQDRTPVTRLQPRMYPVIRRRDKQVQSQNMIMESLKSGGLPWDHAANETYEQRAARAVESGMGLSNLGVTRPARTVA